MLMIKEEVKQQLSKREVQVMAELLNGERNKTIAQKLYISERTVKYHCTNLYRKLDIESRHQLMRFIS